MHAGLVLPCFGDQTALNSGCEKIEILPLKHMLLAKGLLCHFGTRVLTLRNKNHPSNDFNQTLFSLRFFHILFVFLSAKHPLKFCESFEI